MASKELKRVKELRRELAGLNIEELDVAIRRVRDESDTDSAFANIAKRRRELRDLLDAAETRYLIRTAESWGIEVPYNADWYERDVDDSGGVELVTFSDRLNTLGKAVITRQIREARRASVKWWADVLIPLLALAVAFLALFKDIIVEVLKRP